ncbi:MAG TPA: hypothetical protein VMJ32_08990 [Pirellulales bacterium]|nr:hypothetical protein [Pirellulales bacterium]
MKTCMRYGIILLAAALLVPSVATVRGQGPGGGRGFGGMGMMGGGGMGMDPSFLLMSPAVQKELELSDDQKEAVQKYGDDLRASGRDFFQQMQGLSQDEMQKKMQERAKENRKKIADILLPLQMSRLDEISIQVAGAGALNRDDVAEKLGLTDDQKNKIKDLADDTRQKIMDLFSNGPPQDDQERQDMQKRMADIRSQQTDKAMAVLTDEQKTKLEDLKGKKFDTSSLQFGRGPGRGPGGPGGPPGGGPPPGGGGGQGATN